MITTQPNDVDNAFVRAVYHELCETGDLAAAVYAADCAADIAGFGPAEIAHEEGLPADSHNATAVETVADICRREYAASHGAPEKSGVETPNPDAIDDHHRLNEGKDWGGHMVYAELARLERAGVEVQDHRIVETADDNHPDLLEIEYGDVDAETIECEHRYRHIDSTRYYGVASRPLSELPERDGGVNN